MERIRLTKAEKTVLRLIGAGTGMCPKEYPAHLFAGAVRTLEMKGLVRGPYVEGGGVIGSCITPVGRLYISENPSLHNPVNRAKVSAVCAAAGVALSVISILAAKGVI